MSPDASIVWTDVAPGKPVRQAVIPTKEPWWEIDLGASMYVAEIRLQVPGPQVPLWVEAFAYGTPWGGAPREGWRRQSACGGEVVLPVDTVARHIRVSSRFEEPGLLAPSEVAIQATSLFGDSLAETWTRAFRLFRDRPLFASSTDRFAQWVSYGEVWERVLAFKQVLAAHAQGERAFIVLCADNCAEWVIADVAAVLLGHVVVPLSPQDPTERIIEIVNRCSVRIVVCDDPARWNEIASSCESIRAVIDVAEMGDVPTDAPRQDETSGDPHFGEDAAGDALYSLLFTSGSTGVPKGAMRSYDAFNEMLKSYGVVQPAVHLSFQPLSHLSERMLLPTVIIHGGQVGFSRGGAHLLEDLATLEPTFVFSVPRLYEVLHARYQRRKRQARAEAPDSYVEPAVLAEVRGAFGRRLQSVSVGSAPTSPEVLAFLRRCFAGLWVTEGYGSTECGTIAVDGRIVDGVDVRLEPVPSLGYDPAGNPSRGEILVRTPHLVGGYFDDGAATQRAFDGDGYFRTGDVGERQPDGSVHVIGRVKNTVKLAHGEFVAPERIETALLPCPLVDQLYVHAEAHASSLAAVVWPSDPSAEESDVLAALRRRAKVAGLSSYETPTRVLLLREPMSVENGLLTVSGKLKRAVAAARFAARLAARLADGDRATPAADSLTRVVALVREMTGGEVDPDAPLDNGAIDSLSAAELMVAIGEVVGRPVSLDAWFAAKTLRALVGGDARGTDPSYDEDLDLEPTVADAAQPGTVPPQSVLLTGATGFLGAHLLEALLAGTDARVICLVRETDSQDAATRLTHRLAALDIHTDDARVTALPGDLAAPRLGLSETDWRNMQNEVDMVVHAGAQVSWLAQYAELRASNVVGTCSLIELAAAVRHKPLHFVSTISCAVADGDEMQSLTRAQAFRASPYAVSKWIAEQHVRRAGARGLPVAIYRPAMIAGHSERGHVNHGDYISRYLRGCITSGSFLDRDDHVLDMTPVDYVADAIVALARRPADGSVYHLANIRGSLSYADLGRAMVACGAACAPTDYAGFRQAALAAGELKALASYFPAAGFALQMGPWPDAWTRAQLLEQNITCPVIDREIVGRYLDKLTP